MRALVIDEVSGEALILTQDARRSRNFITGYARLPSARPPRSTQLAFARDMGCGIIIRVRPR